MAGLVREKMGIDNILINNIGTVIGSHTGPRRSSRILHGRSQIMRKELKIDPAMKELWPDTKVGCFCTG